MTETAKKIIGLSSKVKITAGTTYAIDPAHCLQCGRCVEFCPVNAVDRLHP